MMDSLLPLIPMMLIQVPIAIGVYYLAPKMRARRGLWTVLSLIPVLGWLVLYVLFFMWMGYITDSLNTLLAREDR